eukprot:g16104.t1
MESKIRRPRILSRYSLWLRLRRKRSRSQRPAERAGRHNSLEGWQTQDGTQRPKDAGPYPVSQKSNYELFNCNNFNIRYWSWNYRGCWHQTCPPVDPRIGI